MWYYMSKDSTFILIILGLTTAMILSFSVAAQKNINVTENNLNPNNTTLNNTSLSNVKANNTSQDVVSQNNETNRYPVSSQTNVSSGLYKSQMDNGTKTGQNVNEAGHARYTIQLGSLAKNATNKPGKDLEKVVFICNIM